MTSGFSAVIGLEVHAQLKTRTKMFCGCSAEFGGRPNSRVCPVCLALPGALPTPNREAVRLAVRAALALDADVHRASVWARKNYFYPDLPKGYQITQYDHPLATGGAVRVEPSGRAPRFIRLVRVHVEEDAGKLVHEGFAGGASGVDLNRCGTPLIEIVGAPEIHDPEEAHLFLERLRSILRGAGVCDADMEKGELRCDANVSVHREGEPWGARVEIKNLNSFRHVRRALAHEIERQASLAAAGGVVEQETRLWSEQAGATRPMRSKEEAHDYRYFPEPDLPPLVLTGEFIAAAGAELPEAPHRRRDRFASQYGLAEADAHRLTVDRELADYFEAAAAASGAPRAAANWVLSELLGRLNAGGLSIADSPTPPVRLGALIALVESGKVTGRVAKDIFGEMFETGADPADILRRRGPATELDAAALEAICRRIVAEHPKEAETYRGGKTGVLSFFIGQAMQKTAGAADPGELRRILQALLEGGA